MGNIIVSGVLLTIIISAIYYIYQAKKSGVKCIGCPHGGSESKEACGCDTEMTTLEMKNK